jgi:seryl-tRNA synthetase
MLDLKYVTANADAVKQNCRNRHVADDVVAEVDRIVALDTERRAVLQRVEEIRRRQNEVAQATGREKDAAKRGELVAEG